MAVHGPLLDSQVSNTFQQTNSFAQAGRPDLRRSAADLQALAGGGSCKRKEFSCDESSFLGGLENCIAVFEAFLGVKQKTTRRQHMLMAIFQTRGRGGCGYKT